MVIGVDLRPINTGEKSGVEEYTVNLLKHLFFIDRKNQYKLFVNSFFPPKLNFNKLKHFKNVEIQIFSYPNKLLNSSFLLYQHPKIDRLLGGIDVFFSPNIIFTSLSRACKQVITFHDLSFYRHPEFFSLKRRIWHKFVLPGLQARRANRVIAVSKSTRNDLLRLYNLHPKQIKVIYSGVLNQFKPRGKDPIPRADFEKKYNLPSKFILYLGTIEPRKNLEGLILAFNQLKQRLNTDYKLVIAGKPGWLYQDVYKLAGHSPYNRDIIFTGFIDSLDKPYLYRLAEVFVYPSFYEGFGFPPLEAMASGTPVISSNISSLPEVVGDAGLLVDPYNINELTEALFQLLTNFKLRTTIAQKGIERAKRFNWLQTAKQTLNLFEEVSRGS